MLTELKIELIPPWPYGEPETKKDSFWRRVRERGAQAAADGKYGLSDFDADELEAKVKQRFTNLLAARVNAALREQVQPNPAPISQRLRQRLLPQPKPTSQSEALVSIDLVDISYGSLEMLLNLTGLGAYQDTLNTLTPYAIPLIAIFAPSPPYSPW